MPNRNGSNDLDAAVAAEVRAEMRRQNVTVTAAADTLDMRRATLSVRVNGHVPFSPALLAAVGALVGVRASEFTARAERALLDTAPHAA